MYCDLTCTVSLHVDMASEFENIIVNVFALLRNNTLCLTFPHYSVHQLLQLTVTWWLVSSVASYRSLYRDSSNLTSGLRFRGHKNILWTIILLHTRLKLSLVIITIYPHTLLLPLTLFVLTLCYQNHAHIFALKIYHSATNSTPITMDSALVVHGKYTSSKPNRIYLSNTITNTYADPGN